MTTSGNQAVVLQSLADLVEQVKNDVLEHMRLRALPRGATRLADIDLEYVGRDALAGDALTMAKHVVDDWLKQRWSGPERLNTSMVFCDAPGLLGSAWYELGEAENELAGVLLELPVGSAVVVGDHAWFIGKVDDDLELRHGTLVGNTVEDPTSRFEHELEFVDFGEEELSDYIDQVRQALDLPMLRCIESEFDCVREGQNQDPEKVIAS